MFRSVSLQAWVPPVATTAVLAGLLTIVRPIPATTDDADSGPGVTFSGRVVDLANKKPVDGASVVVERSIPGIETRALPAWVGETTIRTDADGRFRLSFPPEQVAEPRLSIVLHIAHLGFVRRKSRSISLAGIIRGQAMGGRPFFETIALEKGLEYTGQIVTSVGKPAAGVSYHFRNWTRGNRSPHFSDESEGRTDAEGRFRLRMPKSQGLALHVTPPQPARASSPDAPYQHFWGTDNPSRNPDVWAPTDFGRIVLSRGVRLSGRVVNTEGRPIVDQTINALGLRGRDHHSATTEADGSFSLGPLRPANYLIHGEGQLAAGVSPDAPVLSRPIRVIHPMKVYLKDGVLPEPVVLRELPSVRVEVRFVDSQGKPAAGSPATIAGIIPTKPARVNPFGGGHGLPLASELNDPEPQDMADRLDWGVQDRPDTDGRIVFRAPKGLQEATLDTYPFDETISYKTRLEENGPLKFWGGGRLGTLDADRKITVICYRAPTLVVTIRTDNGAVPEKVEVNARFKSNWGDFGEPFLQLAEGRFRSCSLMPDHEYEISAGFRVGEYVSQGIPRLRLPEGAFQEWNIILRKRPKPLEVGTSAPSFSVKTLDGRELSLAGLRGKTVLIHFWGRLRGLEGLPFLKDIFDRFGKDERFVMLGLCLADNPAQVQRVITANGVTWPQAILPDRGRDSVVVDYGAWPPPKAFLIGPDGKLIAREFQRESMVKAVAEALGRK